MKTLLLFAACLLVTGRAAMADCPCGTHPEFTSEIVCNWYYYYDTDEWDFRCDNVSECVENVPEDPYWTPLPCPVYPDPQADVVKLRNTKAKAKPTFSGK